MSELRVTGRRFARAALMAAAALALAACSSQPKPRAVPPDSLDGVNRLLVQRFSDVTLTDGVVLHRLWDVSVTPELLRWTNDDGQRREMAIAQVVRIVAHPKKDGLSDPEKSWATVPMTGTVSGVTGAAVGIAYGVIAFAAEEADQDPGELIYEGPVSRYLPAKPVPEGVAGDSPPLS